MRSTRPRLAVPAALVLLSAVASCGESPQEPGLDPATPNPARNATHPAGGDDGITVPVTGSTDEGGTFQGTLAITGAGVRAGVGPVLVVRVQGVARSGDGGTPGTPGEAIPMAFPPVSLGYAEMEADDDCIELDLQPPPAFDPETKTTVHLDPSPLATRTLPGPGSLLGDLICANYESVAQGMWDVDGGGQR